MYIYFIQVFLITLLQFGQVWITFGSSAHRKKYAAHGQRLQKKDDICLFRYI